MIRSRAFSGLGDCEMWLLQRDGTLTTNILKGADAPLLAFLTVGVVSAKTDKAAPGGIRLAYKPQRPRPNL